MEFERDNVVDELTEDVGKFVGRKGWFADRLTALKKGMEDGGRDLKYGVLESVQLEAAWPFVIEAPYYEQYRYFYPDVEQDMSVEEFVKLAGRVDNVWLKGKYSGSLKLVTAYDFQENLICVGTSNYMSPSRVLDSFTIVDLHKED